MKKIKIPLIVTGVLTLINTGVMNVFLMPQIEETTQGIRCFDMNPLGYSFETAQQFLSLLSEKGRAVYLNVQLPLDFVYPLVYTAFFVLLFYAFLRKKSVLFIFPLLLMLADYAENISIISILKADVLSSSLVSFGSAATVCKSMLMYLCFIIAIILLVRFIVDRKKGGTSQPTSIEK